MNQFPHNPHEYTNRADGFLDQGRLDEAISCYQEALELRPDLPEAHSNMGVAFQRQGNLGEALSCYQQAVQLKPDYAEAYYNMGTVFQAQEKLDEALSYYQQALRLKSDIASLHYNMGIAFQAQGKLGEALSCYQKAVQLKPDYAKAHCNMALAFEDQGALKEAISCYQKAVQLEPRHAEAHYNMGTVFQAQENLDEALSCYRQAVEARPDYAEAYNNMGVVFQSRSCLNEALSCYYKAVQLKPDYAQAYDNMGVAFEHQGHVNEAISYYHKAVQLKPDYAEAYNHLFEHLQQACAWKQLEALAAKLERFTEEDLKAGRKTAEDPYISIRRTADPARNLDIAKLWSSDIARRISSLEIDFSLDGRRLSKPKTVIGYLSSDFRSHATAHLMLGLFELHDRGEFEIFCYSYGEDDKSHYRARIERDCDKFVDLRSLSYAEAARRIYEDHVDILVDLKGYTKDNRLAICAFRPAPIQVSYLGFPGTTGADFFDYIITDRTVTPDDHACHYSEKFVYLPHCYQVNDYMQPISLKDWTKGDFGLPEGRFVFCSFNRRYKIDPQMFDSWMKILKKVPESVLWLQGGNKTAEINLRKEAEARGINPASLVFADKLPKDQHLGRLALADLALDTRIVNGHTTTSDALWAGVPVITLLGGHFASRVSSSILTAIGLPELITQGLDDYEALAVRLGRNQGELKEIKDRLAKNRLTEPFFDTPRFMRNLEKAYQEMWKVFLAGERPRQIEVVEI